MVDEPDDDEIEPEAVPDSAENPHDTRSFRAHLLQENSELKLPDGSVEPFPKERFLDFIKALKIQSRDYGLIPLHLLGSQLYLLEEIIAGMAEGVTTFIILKNRQAGISTFFLALDIFWAFEHKGLLGIFATHDEGSRDQFRNQIDMFLKTLPPNYRVEHNTNNRLMLVFKNSSVFRYLVAGTRTTTNKMGRSGGCNFLHATEVAFWGSADDIKALGQTLTKIYRHRLYAYESTANGFNHFADMWEIAKSSPAQRAIFIGWWRDERNEFSEKHPLYLKYMPEGTQSALTQLERERIDKVKLEYGFDITAGQIAWYRCHLETECSNDQSTMDQEMPWTEEDAFQSTGSSFFTNTTLTACMKEAHKSLCSPFIIKLTDDFRDTRLFQCDISRADLKIWEKPVAGARYVIGADPIFGSSPNGDNGVIHVARAFSDCMVQVAEYASPSISTHQFAWALAFICGLYGDITLNLEITGPGGPVYQELTQLRQKLVGLGVKDDQDMRNCLKYIKDFFYRRVDSMTGSVLKQWKTTPETRIQMLHKLHDGIELRRAHIRSLMCLNECKSMYIDDDGYIGSPPSKCNDRVFAAALTYWAWDETVRLRMKGEKLTRAAVMDAEKNEPRKRVDGLVARYMKDMKLTERQ